MLVEALGALSARSLIRNAEARLRGVGTTAPEREVRWLWARVIGDSPAARGSTGDGPLPPGVVERFRALMARREAGEPLAYVLGTAGFRHLELSVDRRALIPRPETEQIIDLVLARGRGGVVADVGTGSGCIALALAQEGAYDQVIGIDRSADALALARHNAVASPHGVRYLQGDLVSPLGASRVDVLVSNPPYLTDGEYADLDRSVRAWEPAEALASGPDGLTATRSLLEDGRRVVRPGGWIVLETDSTRNDTVARMAAECGWADVGTTMDLYGRARFVTARRSELHD